MHKAGNHEVYTLGLEAYAPDCGQGDRQEVDMSGRREMRRAMDKEAEELGIWTRRKTHQAMDNKEADAPDWRRMLPAVDKEAEERWAHQAGG